MSTTVDESRPRYRWTVAEYHKMVAAGVLTEDSRVELIDGEVVEMAPIGSEHAGKVARLIYLFASRLGEQAIVTAQNPIELGEDSEPQPDIAILRWREDFYENAHPGPADVLLLIEVAGTSAAYDRRVKAPLYARHGIPELWLVDLQRRSVEVYRQPGAEGYGRMIEHRKGQVSPEQLSELGIGVDELFPVKKSATPDSP